MDEMQRWEILRLHIEDDITLTDLAQATDISTRTLSRWVARYRADGIRGLRNTTRSDAGAHRISAELVAYIEHLGLTKPRPSIAALHRLVSCRAQQLSLKPPSYATVRSIIQALDPAMVTLALEGPTSYRDRHELVYRHRAEHPNAIWQADHTQLDILIQNPDGTPTRPWLTIIIDDYSRAVCGYMVTTTAPSAMNTALALRQAIWRKTDPTWAMCGIPDVLYVDHGSDFTSGHITYTTTALKIRIIHSTIARPQGRGKIERFFSTVNTELLTTLPGHLAPGVRNPHPVLDLTSLDTAVGEFITARYERMDAMLLGRVTWDIWASYWPHHDAGDPVSHGINVLPKYVPSTTLKDPAWQNTHVIEGDVEAAVRELKAKPGRDLLLQGSGGLLRWLLERDLVDELNLVIYPLILGAGMRLFPEQGQSHRLEPLHSRVTPTGVVIQTFRPAGRTTFGRVDD